MKLYNTLSRTIEDFKPIHPPTVGMYTCGITAYDFSHIGHGRKYVGDDVLRRILTYIGFTVTHVQNVTDVGHLVSDADEGEDKLEKGAKKIGKTVWEVAQYYMDDFYQSMDRLNVLRPTVICRATDHIPEQIDLVKQLLGKGLAYDTPEAVYFDINKFPEYSTLFGQSLTDKKVAVRDEVQTGDHKKNSYDFALWFKRVGRFADHAMHWESPWGDGFPGWHIECSAMSMKYLGDTFDIHTGGIDHISIHHPNEIAQSQGVTGKPLANVWVHHAFITVDGQKMSKSLGNFYRVLDITEKGYDPLAIRYFYFSAHYRKPLNFTWQALDAASNSLKELRSQMKKFQTVKEERSQLSPEKLQKADAFREDFLQAISNDMNMPQALAVLWEVVKSNIPSQDKHDLILDFDTVLGLNLQNTSETVLQEIPQEVTDLLQKREEARKNNDFALSDRIRKEIETLGFRIQDTKEGARVEKQ